VSLGCSPEDELAVSNFSFELVFRHLKWNHRVIWGSKIENNVDTLLWIQVKRGFTLRTEGN